MHAPLKVARTRHSELRALLGLRDAARAVLSLEAANVEDTPELDAMREQLRDSYLDYYDRYGPINRFTERRTGKYDEAGADILARVTPPAVALLGDDPFGPLVLALEHFDEGTRTAAPAGLLSQRQVQPRRPVLGVDTPDEALAVTLDTLGAVELANIAGLLGTDEASARESLGELVYEMPGEPGVYETRAEYLSGDVREKRGSRPTSRPWRPYCRPHWEPMRSRPASGPCGWPRKSTSSSCATSSKTRRRGWTGSAGPPGT